MMGDLFTAADARQSEKNRDAGIERVELNNLSFIDRAIAHLEKYRAEHLARFTGEDLRNGLISFKIEPDHPNAWGALTMRLVKRGIIEETGEYVKMKDPRSHARKTPVYRWKA